MWAYRFKLTITFIIDIHGCLYAQIRLRGRKLMQDAVCKVEAHNLSRAEINVRTGMQISGFQPTQHMVSMSCCWTFSVLRFEEIIITIYGC